MSIDSFFYVLAGTRDLEPGKRGYKKYKSVSDFVAAHGDHPFPHQVKWVAGGWIDEHYFFEDPEDARWFFVEGWRQRDFSDGGCPVGFAPSGLWIDGHQRCEHCAEPLVEGETEHVRCETCHRPLTLCECCWNDSDDCPECEEEREREMWCPLCDLPLVNLSSDDRRRHYLGHKD